MDCQIVKVKPNTEQWDALRRCRITCSRLGDVMAKPTTKRYKQYQKELVLELLGHVAVEENPEWFAHGREMEPRAIAAYEFKTGVDVDHDVFLIHKDYDWLSCSPDGLTLPDYEDGLEFKCRRLYKNYRHYAQLCRHFEGKTNACPPENRHQVQGAMMVTGQDRWGYVNYYEGQDLDGKQLRKLSHVWIPRDEKLISDMEVRCLEFIKEVYELAGVESAA